MVRLAILELNYRTETIFALIESPSDKHQRHARRYSTNVSRIHTAIRQKSAAYTPLFNKCQRHTHRYLTNVSGIHRYSTKFSGILTAIRQMSAVYTPLFDKVDVHSYIHTTRACVHIFAAPIPNKFASIRTTTLRYPETADASAGNVEVWVVLVRKSPWIRPASFSTPPASLLGSAKANATTGWRL